MDDTPTSTPTTPLSEVHTALDAIDGYLDDFHYEGPDAEIASDIRALVDTARTGVDRIVQLAAAAAADNDSA